MCSSHIQQVMQGPHAPQTMHGPATGPRACPQIAPQRDPPAGNINHRNAADVWTFYEKIGSPTKLVCKFCQCISYFFPRIHFLTSHSRNLARSHPHHVTTVFSVLSSTSTLRSHLILKHNVLWVQGCDRLGIPIKTDAGLAAAERIQGALPGEHRRKDIPARQFSNTAFVDAIVEYIIGDDMVFIATFLYCSLLMFLTFLAT